MTVVITYDGNTPTVGADADAWGGELNTALTQIRTDLLALAALANANETSVATANAAANTAQTTANQAVNPGVIGIFARSTAPSGWLVCDGSALSIATYPGLAAACGTFYNLGTEPAGTFRIPDFRGVFIRGWDGVRGLDSGRVFGSYQADELAAHTHLISPPTSDGDGGSGLTATGSGGSEVITPYASGSTGGTETRPKNVAQLICIKT